MKKIISKIIPFFLVLLLVSACSATNTGSPAKNNAANKTQEENPAQAQEQLPLNPEGTAFARSHLDAAPIVDVILPQDFLTLVLVKKESQQKSTCVKWATLNKYKGENFPKYLKNLKKACPPWLVKGVVSTKELTIDRSYLNEKAEDKLTAANRRSLYFYTGVYHPYANLQVGDVINLTYEVTCTITGLDRRINLYHEDQFDLNEEKYTYTWPEVPEDGVQDSLQVKIQNAAQPHIPECKGGKCVIIAQFIDVDVRW